MKIHININVMDYPRIISEAHDKVIEEALSAYDEAIDDLIDY